MLKFTEHRKFKYLQKKVSRKSINIFNLTNTINNPNNMEVLTVQNQYNDQHYNDITTTRIKSKYYIDFSLLTVLIEIYTFF